MLRNQAFQLRLCIDERKNHLIVQCIIRSEGSRTKKENISGGTATKSLWFSILLYSIHCKLNVMNSCLRNNSQQLIDTEIKKIYDVNKEKVI